MKTLDQYSEHIVRLTIEYVPRLILAIVVLVIGLWVVEKLGRIVSKAMERREFDTSLRSFLASMVTISLKVLLLVTVAGMIGIQTTSFVALLGAAGLAVGLALQGSLSNFAGGVLVLVFKPYKVGDLIEAQGQTGKVKEIQIFNTIMVTGDNKAVILPNGAVANGNIINHSKEETLVVVISLPLHIKEDVQKARDAALSVVSKHPKVLSSPAPVVRLMKITTDSLTVNVSCHVMNENYWDVYFTCIEEIKNAFDANGINFADVTKVN